MVDPIDVDTLAVEVADSNFDDERLNKRLRAVVAGLAANPGRSLPKSFDGAGLEGAYRFFSNPRVTPDDILAPHVEATRQRCQSAGDFLVVHDSTKFAYRFDGERQGLGRAQLTNSKSKQMFFGHLSLALAADGTRRPLGVAALKTWIRGSARSGVEYQRWETQLRTASERLGGLKGAIHLMDREADDYEMFASLVGDGHRFVVRCLHNRWLEHEPKPTKLHDVFATLECSIGRQTRLTRRKEHRNPVNAKIHPARAARTANLSVAATTVALKRPLSRRAHTDTSRLPASVTLNVVRVWEANPPAHEEPVEWFLYTTEPIDSAEQQLAVVDHYRARWTIEEYFKALKTGCEFEKRQLQDYEALINLLATFAPIAYQMLLIRSEARRTPEADALSVVSTDQLDVLRACGRLKLCASPKAREIYFAIAALGGHIKYAGDPGWLTLARGLAELETLTKGWVAAKLQLRSDQR
jgi:hypothetical protein